MTNAPPTVQELRAAVRAGNLRWRAHALERLLERGIARSELLEATETGKIIESYERDEPFPSALVATSIPSPLHVVMALDRASGYAYVITAYRPDAEHFEANGETRRRNRS